jgi:hypothetical protein
MKVVSRVSSEENTHDSQPVSGNTSRARVRNSAENRPCPSTDCTAHESIRAVTPIDPHFANAIAAHMSLWQVMFIPAAPRDPANHFVSAGVDEYTRERKLGHNSDPPANWNILYRAPIVERSFGARDACQEQYCKDRV